MSSILSGASRLYGVVRFDGAVAVLTLKGDIDSASAGLFSQLLTDAIDTGARRIVVDMTAVEFMSAAGLNALVRTASPVRAAGRQFSIIEVPGHILRVFDIAGLSGRLGVSGARESSRVAQALAHIVSAAPGRQVLDAALAMVATMTQAVMAGAHGASITLPRNGRLGTVAASNDVVLEMDHDQYETGEGPCLDAATLGERFHIDSLFAEDRWPAFVPRARARGIESILSTPLVAFDEPIGALNVYSRTEGAFAVHEKEWADQFAAEASKLMVSARSSSSMDHALAGIQDALESRQAIAAAQGFVMHRDGVTQLRANAALTGVSRRTGQPLREVAEALVHGHDAAAASSEEQSDVRR